MVQITRLECNLETGKWKDESNNDIVGDVYAICGDRELPHINFGCTRLTLRGSALDCADCSDLTVHRDPPADKLQFKSVNEEPLKQVTHSPLILDRSLLFQIQSGTCSEYVCKSGKMFEVSAAEDAEHVTSTNNSYITNLKALETDGLGARPTISQEDHSLPSVRCGPVAHHDARVRRECEMDLRQHGKSAAC